MAAMPKKEVQKRGVTIELDRQQSGCAIYHAYGLTSGPPFATLTIGWWSVDLRTAEVWDELSSKRVTSGEIAAIQRTVRRRLGVKAEEISAAFANPCYERYSKEP